MVDFSGLGQQVETFTANFPNNVADLLAQDAGGALRGLATQGLNFVTGKLLGETTAIVDSGTLLPVFYGAQIMRVHVRETSRVMSHPLETGVTVSDHHVIEPKTFDVSVIIPAQFYISVYQQIKSAFVNAELLILQSNADVYTNLIVAEMPHEETPDMFGVISMGLRLREVLFIPPTAITTKNITNPSSVPTNYAPAAPKDSNTVVRGPCSISDLSPAKQKAIFDYAGSLTPSLNTFSGFF